VTARILAAQLAGLAAFALNLIGRCLLDVAAELEQATAPRPMRVPNTVPAAWIEDPSW
jgi:hypothetical protein